MVMDLKWKVFICINRVFINLMKLFILFKVCYGVWVILLLWFWVVILFTDLSRNHIVKKKVRFVCKNPVNIGYNQARREELKRMISDAYNSKDADEALYRWRDLSLKLIDNYFTQKWLLFCFHVYFFLFRLLIVVFLVFLWFNYDVNKKLFFVYWLSVMRDLYLVTIDSG